ncbi:hypothetical protein RclHR1_03900021 [Rhizophagus clarus]|uniref:CCHC-type domain-containing protein n=1 Tax=Rhizophagus clarus TaxID=94130 RepID=A0A2Z6REV6_9GLOM|nr:hypothetical protein RclHR1_03900021 [Rhizophagus clarus]
MDRACALETALSLNMELSAYSLISDYLQNMNGGIIPAKTNMAIFQFTYTATQQVESIKKIVERKISEGIAAVLDQIRTESKPYQNNQGRNSGCYLCGKPGHIAKNCRQRSFQNNGNNSNNNNNNQRNNNNNHRNIECYNCGRKGHISKDCRAPSANKPKPSNSTNNENNVIFNSCEQENTNLNKEKSVKWKEPLEEFKKNEPVKQILKRSTYVMNILYQDNGIYLSKRCQKNKEMYNLWQIPGGKVELGESSIQAVLRKTQKETAIKLKKEELTYLFNDPNFNCDIYATKLISNQKLEHTESDKQGPWELFNWDNYKEMANQELTTPTHITYIEEILKSLVKEKSTYVHQIEEVKEALFGKAEVYGEKVNVLIDSGAVGCIISKRYLDKVDKAIDTSTSVRIIDVTGKKTAPLGLVRQVPIKIRDIETRMDMIVTEPQEYNVLLGNIWLKYVNAIINYNDNTMKIKCNDQIQTIPVTCMEKMDPTRFITIDPQGELELEEEEDLEPTHQEISVVDAHLINIEGFDEHQ